MKPLPRLHQRRDKLMVSKLIVEDQEDLSANSLHNPSPPRAHSDVIGQLPEFTCNANAAITHEK